ncbi:hypothetical protein D3C85_1687740 [compost metagenome]
MMSVGITNRINPASAQRSGNALDGFDQKASGPQPFKVLGQVPVDTQGPFTVDAFVNALHRANEQAQSIRGARQGEGD